MDTEVLNIFSRYELQARIFPSFITFFPIGATVLIWYSEFFSLKSSFSVLFVLLIILFSLAKIARECGRKFEKQMKEEEGVFSTTEFLKHHDRKLNRYTKLRYHKFLNENIHGMQLPTEIEELESPNSCNEKYNSAVDWLLEKTRDHKKYPLIYENNINYGFSRNMFGIKNVSICLASFSFLIDIFVIYQNDNALIENFYLKAFLSIFVSLYFIVYWVFLVKRTWVKSVAEAYARSLLAACEKLD